MLSSILSAAITALDDLMDLKSICVELESQEKTLSDIKEIEQFLTMMSRQAGMPAGSTEQVPLPQALLAVETSDEQGNRVPAEVRIISKGEAGETKILREQTGLDGQLETAVDAGREYRIEIKKGFEYPIYSHTVCLQAGEHGKIVQSLARGVDLRAMGWVGGDLHHHSHFSDGVDSPYEVFNSMLAVGLAFGALSDHNNTEQQKIWDTFRTDSFLPILSNELSAGYGHVMNMSPSLVSSMEKRISFRDNEQAPRKADSDRSVSHDPADVKLYREALTRVTGEIRAAGGISQINHPIDVTEDTSLPTEFYDSANMFDCFELINSGSPTLKGFPNDNGINLWFDLLSKGIFVAASAGSDNHNNRQYEFTDEMRYFHSLAEAFSFIDRWPEHLRNTGRFLQAFYEHLFPKIEKWTLEGMGTGSSRVYAYTRKPCLSVDTSDLFDALKSGHSFVSCGPILLPSVNGKIPGETVCGKSAHIDIRLYSNKPLATLSVLTGNRQTLATRELANSEVKAFYDYHIEIEDFDLSGIKFLVFLAQTDHTNIAVSNPIFIEN